MPEKVDPVLAFIAVGGAFVLGAIFGGMKAARGFAKLEPAKTDA